MREILAAEPRPEEPVGLPYESDEEEVTDDVVQLARSSSDGVEPEDWMSEQHAREELATLARAIGDTFTEVPPAQGILRPELLEVLIRERPTSREEWLRKIPLDLRIDTAPEHMVVLDDILSVLNRIAT